MSAQEEWYAYLLNRFGVGPTQLIPTREQAQQAAKDACCVYYEDSADVVSDIWEPKYNILRSALERINAVKTDDPIMGFQEYYDAVTDITRQALKDDDSI